MNGSHNVKRVLENANDLILEAFDLIWSNGSDLERVKIGELVDKSREVLNLLNKGVA